MTRPDAAPVTPGQPTEQPQRAIRDVLEGRVRITLAGQEYVLPVLTIGQNADWRAELSAEFDPILAAEDDLDKVMKLLEAFSDRLLDFVRSYDVTNVLPPPGKWERDIYPHELLRAVMEVRLATDPSSRYAVALRRTVAPKPRTIFERALSALTSSWHRPMGGPSRRSAH